MKKFILRFVFVLCASTMVLSSCGVDETPVKVSQTPSEQIIVSEVKNVVDIAILADQSGWMANAKQINELLAASENGNATATAELEGVLGVTKGAYIETMTRFAVSINAIYEAEPQLANMNNAQRQDYFNKLIANNAEISGYLTQINEDLRACFLQDLCNGIVSIAALVGGPVLCDIISGAVPIIGGALCGIVIDLAKNLLTGICNGLPC